MAWLPMSKKMAWLTRKAYGRKFPIRVLQSHFDENTPLPSEI